MKSVFQEIPLVINHHLFSIQQINHTVPLKSISELPDITLSVVRKDGTFVHGHFKITTNLDCKENFSRELVTSIITDDLKRQVTELGYHIPVEVVVEEPASQPVGGFQRIRNENLHGITRRPIRAFNPRPIDLDMGMSSEEPFLYGLDLLFRKVFNIFREASPGAFRTRGQWEDIVDIRLFDLGTVLRFNLPVGFTVTIQSSVLEDHFDRNSVALASGRFNSTPLQGHLGNYSEYVNCYTPTFDEDGSFQSEVMSIVLKAAPFLEGILTDLNFSQLSK